jgi:hypothetical protein
MDKDVDKTTLQNMIKESRVPVSFPLEHLHAWLGGFAKSIKDKDEDAIKEWERAALTSVVEFHHMTEDTIQYRSMQSRENLAADFEALRTTPLMRILSFGAFKVRVEASGGKHSAADLLQKYKTFITLGPRSEKLTLSFVDHACTILNRMFVIPGMAKLLQEADDLPSGTNPLEGTTKLQAVISKARTPDRILLVVESILDSLRAGLLTHPPPLAAFTGSLPSSGGKGLVDLIIYKFELSHYLLHEWVVQHAFPAEQLITMRQVFASIRNYRKVCGYANSRNDSAEVSLTFRAGWPQSCEELFTIIEQILFDVTYDSYLKDALKNSSQPGDCAASYINEFLDPIAMLAGKDKDRRCFQAPFINNNDGNGEAATPSGLGINLFSQMAPPTNFDSRFLPGVPQIDRLQPCLLLAFAKRN